MVTSFDGELQEGLRDAMLALYLHEAVPKDPYIIQHGLVDNLKTPNDLYEYWLLDVLVSQNVPTSPVACTIASLQQLINRMMMNMEPGYGDNSLSLEQVSTWQNGLNRYPIWAARQQLQNFPDLYLDPTLRRTKTDSFKQLEDDITQAQIQPDTIESAVLAYMGRFEEIANLLICGAYIDGEDFANSIYYLIARSPAENAYYWRALDMSQRPLKAPATSSRETPQKFDKPLPHAWQDWQRANVPIPDNVLQHTIRPCSFNKRLFIVWAQVEQSNPDLMPAAQATQTAQEPVQPYPLFRLYACYKKYDNTWSTPRVYIEYACKTPALIAKTPEDIAAQTHTIAVYDHSTSPESLVLMVYSGFRQHESDPTGDLDQYDFLRTVRIDKNFNVTPLFPSLGSVLSDGASRAAQDTSRKHVLLIGHTFASEDKNHGRFQFWLPSAALVFGSVTQGAPDSPSSFWNYNKWQSRIKTAEKDISIVYDRQRSNIELSVKLDEGFDNIRAESFALFEDDAKTRPVLSITLIFNEASLHKGSYTLLPGSQLMPVNSDFFDRNDGVYLLAPGNTPQFMIIESNGKSEFSLPRTAAGGTASLAGKLLRKSGLDFANSNKGHLLLGRTSKPEAKLTISKNMDHGASGPFYYRFFIGHPRNVQSSTPPSDYEQINTLYTTDIVPSLARDSALTASFSIDQSTHRPDGWSVLAWPEDPKDLSIPLIFGVQVYERVFRPLPQWTLVGAALKTVEVSWGAELSKELQIAPSINSLKDLTQGDSPSLGKAQFIDFSGSSIKFTDGSTKILREPIRLNTTFVRHLINLAESGMENLFNWNNQKLPEPPISKDFGPASMDFSGGYSLYFLELFLYLPWLVAHRLNQERQYDEAKRWLAFLFNPLRQTVEHGHPGYWQAVPLEEAVWPALPDPSQAILDPEDPHRIALSFPVHLRKALYGLYIDIESDQADAAYAEMTPDGLTEAKLRYTHILNLLGERPDVRQTDDWTPITLDQLSATTSIHLRQFEQQLLAPQYHLKQGPPWRIGLAPASPVAPLICLRPSKVDEGLSSLDNPYLRRPFNPELIQRWERAQSRLYNLRHNLDMMGNVMDLPLYAVPIDPHVLLAAQAQGISGTGLNRLLNPQIPHYRFSFMFVQAQNAVESVIQFGSTLLSLIERKEQARFLELQQRQAWDLAKVTVDIQRQLSSVDDANREALSAAQSIAQNRFNYYDTLVNEGVSPGERLAIGLHLDARVLEAVIGPLGSMAETTKALPNIAGLAFGGHRLEGVAQAPIHILQAGATVLHGAGETLTAYEHYRRRAQDWSLARDQAKLEIAHIEAQRKVLEEQHKATRLQVRHAQTALAQAKTTYDFLLSNNRFSQAQTYEWLNSKFAGFYQTAFTTAQSLCQACEACWQYETCRYDQSFIRPGVWNKSYRGLGAGEELKMALLQMHREYLQQHVRDLEIQKTVSLKALKAQDPSAINKTWEEIKPALLTTGSVEFELTKKMLDDDYAGQNHYLRRIKTISVSFPAVLGPYQDICATLTQFQSTVQMSVSADPSLDKKDLKVNQQIALSQGLNDHGQFQLNFQDERYLPFEYTGAISRWRLTFPNPTAQQSILNSLNDIIVHMSYTARPGGGSR